MAEELRQYMITGVPQARVSSVRVRVQGPHAHLDVFNRGASAGTLTVAKEDAPALVAQLLQRATVLITGDAEFDALVTAVAPFVTAERVESLVKPIERGPAPR